MRDDTRISIPDYLPGAAFLVKDHVIVQLNLAAEQKQIPIGARIHELISAGSQEYDMFTVVCSRRTV